MSLKYKVVQLVNPAKREEPKSFMLSWLNLAVLIWMKLPIVFQKPQLR